MTTTKIPVRVGRRATGSCPDCGAEVGLSRGRISNHQEHLIRGGRIVEGGRCLGEGELPDVDLTDLDPVVVEIVRRRRAHGWTRTDLAAAMGRHRRSVSLMERGLSSPMLPFVRAALTALGADLVVGPTRSRGTS